MRVVVIGGTGHIGTFLTPRLVEAGHRVILRQAVFEAALCDSRRLAARRACGDGSKGGGFGEKIAELKPDVVIDLICYTLEEAQEVVQALCGRVQHFLHCGTIWVHGPSVEVPVTEEQPRRPFGDYGCRKAAIEKFLLNEARINRFPATVLHPGHLVGPGWTPLNPAANFNPRIFTDLARGNEVALPNLGMETVHHVHADDVAQAFVKSMAHWAAAVGESFHVVSPAAMTLMGYAEMVADWFGKEARLRFLPWEEWRQTVSETEAAITWDHIARSPNCSTEKARRAIGYAPRYRSIEAVTDALGWMVDRGLVER